MKLNSKLRSWLWPARLRNQIALSGGLMLMLTSGVLTGYLTAQGIDDELKATTLRTQALAKNLAIAISSPLITERYSDIEEILVLQSRFPDILDIQLTSPQGQQLIQVTVDADNVDKPEVQYAGNTIVVPSSTQPSVVVSYQQMTVWQPIEAGSLLGWLRIEHSLQHLRASQSDTLQQGMIISIVAIACSTALFLFFLARPMRAIAQAAQFARLLNQHRGLSFDTDRRSQELEQLGEALNEASWNLHAQEQSLTSANAELRNEKERFRAVTDSANEAIVTSDEHGQIVYLNPAALVTFGYNETELTGQALTLLIPEKLHSAHQDMFQSLLASTAEHTTGKTIELKGLRKNGTEFPLEISLATWKTTADTRFFTSVMRNISRRRRGQEAVLHLASIVESSNDSIVSETLDGIITSWNSAATILYGYTASEMLNQSIFKIIPPNMVAEKKKFLERIQNGEQILRQETTRLKNGGKKVDVAITVSPLRDANGNIIGTSTIARDITERKLAEARIRELSLIDDLTGLYNRRGFITLAEPQLALNRRSKQGLLLLYADMDGFKHINDTLGHVEGDRALEDVAQILRATFRDSDIISRIGGDEFAIIACEHLPQSQEATICRLQDNLNQFNLSAGRAYTLAISVGSVFQEPGSTQSLDEILAKADAEMYRVKNQQHNQQKS